MRRESLGSLLMTEKRRGKSQIRSEWEGQRCNVDFSPRSDLYCEGKKRKWGGGWKVVQCSENCFDYFYMRGEIVMLVEVEPVERG